MTATEFWRDLEIRFRALHDEQCRRGGNHVVCAFWSSVGLGPDGGNPWSVSGGSTLDRTKFESFAQSAAVRLGHSGGPTAVFAWLDRLKAESPRYKGGIPGKFEEPKASKVIETESGLIEFLGLASAEFCRKCETQEIVEARATSGKPVSAVSPLLEYRSETKRAILVQLTKKPKATDLEVCRGLDADGAAELPVSWRPNSSGDRLFANSYMDRSTRGKIERTISKVRADMRARGLLTTR